MGHKNPIWELFHETGAMYGSNKSNKAAWCKACLREMETQLRQEEITAAARGAQVSAPKTDKQWEDAGFRVYAANWTR
ncbi:hypothetical protein R3P38DRAFT_3229229 [Favolaschia claudopus]|uniref:Uncharacterized protein n=1 Tax=Favolaschia claudopus TaxID=2862362 RepID=A0AAV9ZPD0_9AGAR